MAWNSNNSYNKYTDTYFKGVVDVSGGNIINRNGNLVLGSYTLTPTILNYLSTISSDIQVQVTNLAATAGSLVTKTQYIAYSGGTTTVSSPLAFTSTLNNVLPSTFAYISTLSSSAQSQFNTLTSNLTTTNSNVTSLTTAVATNTTNLTNILYGSGYTNMTNVYISTDLINYGTTSLNNTVLITGNISANSQTITPTQLGYLSGLSGDVQTAITNLNNKTIGISAAGGGYTNISFLDATNFLYSATGSQLDGTTLINGALTLGTTASIVSNSLTISPTVLGYLANVTSDIQTQINGISTANFVTIGTSQTITGNKVFNGTVTLNNITASSIPDTALASTFVKTTGAVTKAGILTLSSPPVMSGASISTNTIPDTALVETYLKLSGIQTVSGLKTFSNNVVFSGNPNFSGIPTFGSAIITDANLVSTFVKTTGAVTKAGILTLSSPPVMSGASITSGTIPISALASTTFTTTINGVNILLDNTANTGFYTMNSGVSTVNSFQIKARSSTATYNNPTTVSGDVEIASFNNGTAGAGGLNLCIGSTVSGGIRLTESNIAFNSPITITGNITSNSQTVTPTNLGYLSGATSNIQTAITSNTSTISSHTTSITSLQTQNTAQSYSGTTTSFSGTLAVVNATFSGTLNSISTTQFGFLSGLTQNINTALTSLQTATTYITTSSSNEVQMLAPLRLYPPTLQPSGNQLGTYQQSWYTGSGSITTATQNICSITLSPGTYLMTILYDIYHTTGSASEQVTASVSTTSATHAVAQSGRGPYNQFYPTLTAGKESQQYTMWVSNASGGNTTYYFVITLSTAAVMTNQSFMDATRIG